ncbi:hypothetical protein D3C78_1743420 [compost metagenome]
MLVCDGGAGFESVVKAYLEPRGMRVEGVADASGLVAGLRESHPALVLLDEAAATPAVLAAITGAAVPVVQIGATEDSTTPRLPKPFKKAELVAAVERAMAGRAGASS